jgi:ribosome assembly protein RRB1
MAEGDDEEEQAGKPAVWVPGRDALEDGETLQYDPTAYDCMSSMSLDWPALSFDFVRDALGEERATFPASLLMVAGTQAADPKRNYLAVMKVSNLSQGKHGAGADGDSDDDMSDGSDAEGEEADDARLHVRKVAHTGGVNRVRAMPQRPGIVASWADTAQVQVWDVAALLSELAAEAEPTAGAARVQKLAARQVHTHAAEGFALDWSPAAEGRLASGDCRARIHVWEAAPGGRWAVGAGLKGHEASVEDLQWSPGEATVFASASVDRTIRIWDTREPVSARRLNTERKKSRGPSPPSPPRRLTPLAPPPCP